MYYPVYVSIKSSLVSSPLETLSEFSQGGILLICAKCKLTDPLCVPVLSCASLCFLLGEIQECEMQNSA